MSDSISIPFELRAIGAEEVGQLLGLAARTVLETVACRPDFPVRISMRPATWVAGEMCWSGGTLAERDTAELHHLSNPRISLAARYHLTRRREPDHLLKGVVAAERPSWPALGMVILLVPAPLSNQATPQR